MRTVVALGGNAFSPAGVAPSMAGELRFARETLSMLAPILRRREVLITHGNGPQVGFEMLRVEAAADRAYALPLEACVAESEGELGYVLGVTLYDLFARWNETRKLAVLLTHVIVDAGDPAFEHPTKPIGPFYPEERASALRAAGFSLVHEAGRGVRRLVASPEPLEVLELEVIRRLLEAGTLVIAAGGGGIPVVRDAAGLSGLPAVIDKDLVSSLLAKELSADLFLMLTAVPCAYRFYGTARADPIGRIRTDDLEELRAEGHFPPGSMGPKVEAALRFVRASGRRALITDTANLAGALAGHAGTIVEG